MHWKRISDMTFLLPVPTQTETIPNPGCWQTSTAPVSLRAHPAPLRHLDGQLPPADAVALHPTSAHGHVPRSTRMLGHHTACCVTAPLEATAKGLGAQEDTTGKSLCLGECLSSDIPKEELTKAPMGTVTHNEKKSSAGPWVLPLSPCPTSPTCSCPQHPAHPSRLRCRSRWSHCRGSPRGLYCPYGSPSSRPWASPPAPPSPRC